MCVRVCVRVGVWVGVSVLSQTTHHTLSQARPGREVAVDNTHGIHQTPSFELHASPANLAPPFSTSPFSFPVNEQNVGRSVRARRDEKGNRTAITSARANPSPPPHTHNSLLARGHESTCQFHQLPADATLPKATQPTGLSQLTSQPAARPARGGCTSLPFPSLPLPFLPFPFRRVTVTVTVTVTVS